MMINGSLVPAAATAAAAVTAVTINPTITTTSTTTKTAALVVVVAVVISCPPLRYIGRWRARGRVAPIPKRTMHYLGTEW
jgi:hypothetical protein